MEGDLRGDTGAPTMFGRTMSRASSGKYKYLWGDFLMYLYKCLVLANPLVVIPSSLAFSLADKYLVIYSVYTERPERTNTK